VGSSVDTSAGETCRFAGGLVSSRGHSVPIV
jgi:hypothetical protein